MTVVSIKQFVEAGVHFGHQTRRWNPKMEKYIYGAKHGIHIIDLKQTLQNLKIAYHYTRKISAEGKSVLFVGTKDQARDILVEEARGCDSFFINERWLGGLLTNFGTVRQSVSRMKSYEDMAGPDGSYEGMIKKEALQIDRKRQKLERSLGGVKDMQRLPSAIFIVDCVKEHIAVKEAQKLNIPIMAVVDTNCNPEGIDYPIPGNDDAPRAIRLYASVIATAIREGKDLREQRLQAEKLISEKAAPPEKESGKKIIVDLKVEEKPEATESAPVEAKAAQAPEETPEATESAPVEAKAAQAPVEVTETVVTIEPEAAPAPEEKATTGDENENTET